MKKIKTLFLLTITAYNLNAQNDSINGTLTVKDLIKLNNSSNNQVFQIRPGSGYSGYIYWAENAVAERGILGFQAGSADLVYRSGGTSFSNGIERFRVKSNGNFGIGTTSPLGKVDILSETDGVALRLSMSTNEDAAAYDIKWANSNADIVHRIQYANTYYDFMNVNRATRNVSFNGGKVGIGTASPQTQLEVVSSPAFTAQDANSFVIRSSNSSSTNDSRMTGMTITLDGSTNVHSSSQKSVGLFAQSSGSWSNNVDMLFYTRGSSQAPYFSEKMRIKSNGKVGIGTDNPQNLLSVNGTIWAKEVKVSLTDGADWVFEDGYDLKSLEEVEKFIKKNKHLQEIPSANEMRENDLSLGEMNNKLLQKVEELTLYLIEQNKEINKMKKEISSLKNE